jgi:ADP-ribose pyrophosphatase YjhB (NUDIX family)
MINVNSFDSLLESLNTEDCLSEIENNLFNIDIEHDLNPLTEETEWSYKNRYPVFIILMHSGTMMSNVIKKVTKDEFSHACISFSPKLDLIYSFGGKTRQIEKDESKRGFVIQSNKDNFYKTHKAHYAIYMMYVNKAAINAMKTNLKYFIDHKKEFKYDVLGLIDIWFGKDSENHKARFCSRFVMEIIGAGIPLDKLPSLYKPQELTNLNNISLVNKGEDFYNCKTSITMNNMRKVREKLFNERTFQENSLPSMNLSDKNLFISYDEPLYPTKHGEYGTDDNVWNSYVIFNNKYYRERVEALIIKDNKVFLSKGSKNNFRIPGGSTEPNESLVEQLENECKEEARIKIKNPVFIGTYIIDFDKESGYWKDLPFKYSGYYIHLYIADYDKEYKGKIAEVDKDDNMIKYGNFYDINDNEILSKLTSHWLYALKCYKKNNLNENYMTEFSASGIAPVSTMGNEPIQRQYFTDHDLSLEEDELYETYLEDFVNDLFI